MNCCHTTGSQLTRCDYRALTSYQLTDRYFDMHRQDRELAICFLARLVRDLSGQPVDPVRAELEGSRPAYADVLEAHLGCPMSYDSGHNRLHYRRPVLALPVRSADASLCEALCFYLADRLRTRDEEEPIAGRVFHLLSVSLRSGDADIVGLARMLGMSRRTLQRRLACEGLVFTDMVTRVRRDIADEYLKRSDYSLTEVALMLGYSDLSSFSRAYRRWTGSSPLSTREEARRESFPVGESTRVP